jgi:hypothetical protein
MALARYLAAGGAAFSLDDAAGSVATRALSPGDVVAACAPAAVLVDSADVCAHCMKRPHAPAGEKLQRCAVCKTAYCSRACQAADWADCHKAECKLLGWLQGQLPDKADFAAALLTARVARGKRLVPTVPSEEGEDNATTPAAQQAAVARVYVHNLLDAGGQPQTPVPHAPGRGPAPAVLDGPDGPQHAPATPRVAGIVRALRACGLLPETIPDDVAAALVGKLAPNAFPLADGLLVRRGVAVAPLAAHLRHSCAPNCWATYVPAASLAAELGGADGGASTPPKAPWTPPAGVAVPLVMVVRAIAPVVAGAPLSLARVDVTLPQHGRDRALRRLVAGTPAEVDDDGGAFASPGAARLCHCTSCDEDAARGEDFGALPEQPDGAPPAPLAQRLAHGDVGLGRLFASSAGEIASDPRGGVTAPTVAKLAASGFDVGVLARPDPPSASERGRLRREVAVLTHALALLRRHLPPFHHDVTAVVDRLYAATNLGGDYASAAPLGYHQVAAHAHACRRCPGHPAVGLQRYALGDLLMNVAIDRAAHYEEQSAAAADGDDGGVGATLRRVLLLPADAPPADALPEVLFGASRAQYTAAAANLAASLGPGCPLLPLAAERCEMLASIVEEAARRSDDSGAAVQA